jgi:response regulator RpfG family c-di-GMP phosphodiesterase
VRGDLSTALIRYQSALERFRELQNERMSAGVLHNMGMLHVDIAEYAAAEMCFNSAYTLAEHLGDLATCARVDVNRAELYIKKQNYERARECCERSFKAFSKLGSERGLAEVHKMYGMLYRETGKPQVAQVQLNLALKLARSCDVPLLEAETQSERARLFINQRRVNEALNALNRAHKLFQELDARREILDLRRRLERLETTYLEAIELWAQDAPSVTAPLIGRIRGRRVADLATQLGAAVGFEDLNVLRIGSYLHDVGNQAVPPAVLEKKGPLNSEELEHIKMHTLYGDLLVKELDFAPEIRPMVRNHHEHWDGTGYPDRLEGDGIPLSARILTIADVYDALTTKRSYRDAFSSEQALEIMATESGKLFDPTLFLTFASMIRLGTITAPREETDLLREAI